MSPRRPPSPDHAADRAHRRARGTDVGRRVRARVGACLAPIAALLVTLAPSRAAAQSQEDALLADCYALRRAGRQADSLARCEQAVAATHSARAVAQLALTEMALERWPEAARHLAAALADEHPWVQQNRASLETALRTVRARVGELRVEADAPGASLRINDGDAVALPSASPFYLAPGPVVLALQTADGRALTRTVTLTAGVSARESFVFGPIVRSASPAAVVAPAQRLRAVPSDHGAPTRRALAWVVAGGSVAGFGLALASWRLREGVVSDFAAQCPDQLTTDATRVDRCAVARAQSASDLATWETLSTVGLIAGGALAAVSVVLFVTAPAASARPPTALACGSGPGTLGLRCALTF
ncbi:MAG: hypothetical protein U0326_02205 [Polyangiales bacterium]